MCACVVFAVEFRIEGQTSSVDWLFYGGSSLCYCLVSYRYVLEFLYVDVCMSICVCGDRVCECAYILTQAHIFVAAVYDSFLCR